MLITIRNLFQEPVRLLLSIIAVALAIMLILILNGFLAGNNKQITSYLDHSPGSVVVAQEGFQGFLQGSTSVLPSGSIERVRAASGVAEVVPILSQFAVLDLHDKQVVVYLVGYQPELGGGPWQLSEGREPRLDNEAVVDTVMAQRHGIELGGSFQVLDRDVTAVGLSEGSTSWMMSFLFLRKNAVESLISAPDATGYLLVSPTGDMTDEELTNRLQDLPGIEVMPKSEMIENDRNFYNGLFNPPLRLMVGVAFLAGTLIVGLVVYTATVERQREFGVLKAIGAPNRLLYQVVVVQALLAAMSGSVAGVGLAVIAVRLIMWARPQFLLTLETSSVIVALVAGVMMALLAALFPVRAIAGIAPADVFRR